ncbi:MAG: GNAT family N-acetyltransferase [Bacteroidales bacterium]|nr:GNAT family N-acetyltransferase [Bacteroidales bacterium]
MEVSIRDYRKGDYEVVNKLWIETGMGGAFRGDDEDVINKTIRVGGRLRLMIEQETEQVIGTSWLSTDHRRLYMHHFGIDPAYQRTGLSKILLKDSLHIAFEMGMQVKLEVHSTNKIAQHVYKKYGFENLGDYDVLIMRDVEKINLRQ